MYYTNESRLLIRAVSSKLEKHKQENDPLQTCQPEECFRGTFRVKKRDLPAKSGTVGRAQIEIVLEIGPIQPT